MRHHSPVAQTRGPAQLTLGRCLDAAPSAFSQWSTTLQSDSRVVVAGSLGAELDCT
jgi:hypothetical protein